MNIKHLLIIITAFALCLAVLVGCTLTVNKEPSIGNNSTDTETVSTDGVTDAVEASGLESEGAEELSELAALRNKIKDADCAVGIAFVDYVDYELSKENTEIYLSHSETVEEYPFLSGTKVVACSGNQLFLLVPASANGVITVFPAAISDEGELEVNKDELIFEGEPGEPVAVKCNFSDSYSNVSVSVTDKDTVCEFAPIVSLEDGCSVALQEGCFDFSVDNIHKYANEARDMLIKDFTEIKNAVDSGKVLVFAGDFYYYDLKMIRFELGSCAANDDGGGEFTAEKQYAVSFDATYAMDPADHEWYVIGVGIDGMGLRK